MKSIFRSLLLPALRAPRLRPAATTARLLDQAFEIGRSLGAIVPPPAPDAAAGAAADATRPGSSFAEHAHTAAGLSRRYKLFVPSTVRPHPALVVMLHGCTQDADDFAAGTRMNAWAEREGFLVVYPIQPRTANPAGCWNWFRDQDQRRDQGEAAFLADLATTVAAGHQVDRGAVFVAGLSAGAAMAAILAREYPDVFAAVGLHSGLAAGTARNVPDAMRAMNSGWRPASAAQPADGAASIPAIVFQGDRDQTVHPTNADHVIESLVPASAQAPRITRSGAGARTSTTRNYGDQDGATHVESWTLHGTGHAWSGGDPSGSYTDPAGVDATAEMVRFFRQHRR